MPITMSTLDKTIWVIVRRGRNASYPAPPAQIPA